MSQSDSYAVHPHLHTFKFQIEPSERNETSKNYQNDKIEIIEQPRLVNQTQIGLIYRPWQKYSEEKTSIYYFFRSVSRSEKDITICLEF